MRLCEPTAFAVKFYQLGQLFQVDHHLGLLAVLRNVDGASVLILKVFNLITSTPARMYILLVVM